MSMPLRRGRQINLLRAGGRHIPVVRMSLGWEAAPRLDAHGHPSICETVLDTAVVLYSRGVPVDLVFLRNRGTSDGTVQLHPGSPTAGTGSRRDESVRIDLRRLPARIDQLALVAASFTGQTFAGVTHTHFRLTDEQTTEELAHLTLVGGGRNTALLLVGLHRQGSTWQLTALGAPASGRDFQELVPAITASLRQSGPPSHPSTRTAVSGLPETPPRYSRPRPTVQR